jgi:hypothetical protein
VTAEQAQWTGSPMREACETTGFFEPDTVYVDDSNPSRAPEFTPEFWCRAVFSHPDVRVLYAVGLFRQGHFMRWHLSPVIWTFTDWKRAQWIESPYGDKGLPEVER